jgi:hypothetical protein
MKRQTLLILLILFTQMQRAGTIVFSEKEKSIIYTNAIKVLDNYQTIINRMGVSTVSNFEKAKSDAESLLELFVNRQVMIYNDLDPEHKLSQFYEAESYSNNIILWYKDGIKINLDLPNAKVSDIMSHEESIYSIDIMVKKSIEGNYLNKILNKDVEELLFRIAFRLENKSFAKFQIVGIRSASSNIIIDDSQALKEVNSENFTPEDLTKIHTGLAALLRDYDHFLALLGDSKESADDKEAYKASFLKLFRSSDTKIFNDINPQPQTTLVSLPDYLTSYAADYPAGIKNLSVNVDSAKFSKMIKVAADSFYTYVNADKFFSGTFKGKDVFGKMFPLKFKISFSATGKTFTNFQINGIDISSPNYFEATPGSAQEKKPEIVIKPVTRKGWNVTLILSLGQTNIKDKDITSLSMTNNLHSWSLAPLFGFIGGAGVNYNLSDNLAAKSGLEFNKYAASYSLSGKFTDNTLSTDVNSDQYYKIVEAKYDSVIKINYLTVPLLVNYTSAKPGKYGYYGEGGLKISIPIGASYKSTGNYKLYGHYPPDTDWPLDHYLYDIIGFYDRQNINTNGKVSVKSLNLCFYATFGISIPLGYFSYLTVGPEFTLGLNDIDNKKEKYIDIFGKSYAHQSTKIRNFGLRFCFTYKL